CVWSSDVCSYDLIVIYEIYSFTVTLIYLANLNAKANVGSYLSFSIAFIVCLVTFTFLLNVSCEIPTFLRYSLILFFIIFPLSIVLFIYHYYIYTIVNK